MEAAATPRTGAALVRATKPFAIENRFRSWAELLWAGSLYAVCLYIAATAAWYVRVPAVLVAGLIHIRLFIIYHDAMHGAVLKGSKLGNVVMWVIGLYTLSPPPVWRETHDYHHRNNCKLPGTSIGSFPLTTTRMWRRMSPSQKRAYKFARHPVTILFAYLTLFVFAMSIGSFIRRPKQHWTSLAALVLHVVTAIAVGMLVSWSAALCAVVLPVAIAHTLGGYLFYAQHNFPSMQVEKRHEWSYHRAALESSSMFDMPRLLHWFTGNIGYHHVHHLNHKIPFYRLPDAMAALPELQAPGRTSWHPRDVAACLALKLWDPSTGKMVGWPAPRPEKRATQQA